MGKSSAPSTPDFTGATQLQGQVSQENLNTQNYANRPSVYTPFGSQTWSTQAQKDPATGQTVTGWQQNVALNPTLQSALDSQMNLQAGRSNMANNFLDRVGSEYSKPMDYSSLPALTSANAPSSLQTRTTDYTPGITSAFNFGSPQQNVQSMTGDLARGVNTQAVQRSLNTGDNPALPQFDSSYRDTVANQLMQKMQPVHDYQTRQLETKLANQGLRAGSEAYNRAATQLGQQQALERYNALDQAGSEAQRLYNMQLGSRQQAFNEDVTGGNFANSASNQAFNQGLQANQFANQATQQAYNQNLGAAQFGNQALSQQYNQNLGAAQFNNQAMNQASALDLARMQAQNQAQSQQFGLNQQYANAQNQLRQQAIAEQAQRRGMSLNEMNALLSGQQVQMPTFPGFSNAGVAQAPNYMGALQNQYDAQLGAVNAQNAQTGNLLGSLANLGSAYFMFSDRRLKSRIKRVGTHEIGVGIYEYTMMGIPQRGVIAQEVQAVRPDLVKRHASGYLMVNYGGL
jgi:hypothetical protein